jgi:antitoxin component of MazEF toxin-antitoxin module
MEKTEYRKIQGIMGNHSLGVILPKCYTINLNLTKGDFVRIYQENHKIIIEKAGD